MMQKLPYRNHIYSIIIFFTIILRRKDKLKSKANSNHSNYQAYTNCYEYNFHMMQIIPTKFFLSPIPGYFVSRPRLNALLDDAFNHKLTLVSSQAGSGKTMLVNHWLKNTHKKAAIFCWLALDENDNDPVRFLNYLVASLEEGGIQLDGIKPIFTMNERESTEYLITTIIQELIHLDQEAILVLDDYHRIQNKDIHRLLEFFIDYIPSHFHVILITRSDPPIGLARLRLAGQLIEIRMENLRFSLQETNFFLNQSEKFHLSEREIDILNQRTEGWIAGLQMAAISLRDCKDTNSFVAAFAGSHRYIFDYLLEQVVSCQSSETQEFLLKTSILERFSAPLCDFILDQNGNSRNLINLLEKTNLFLVPLDDERNWFRYHHLFADLLQLMLERTHPGLASELHQKACRWFENQNMLQEALHHALAAGNMELAAQIVSGNVLMLIEQNEVLPSLQKINSIPHIQVKNYPWLGIAQAWVLATGQKNNARNILDTVENNLDKLTEPNELRRLQSHIAAARAFVYSIEGDKIHTVTYAQQAASLLPEEDIAVRAMNLATWGDILSVDGYDPEAMPILEESLALALLAGKPHVVMVASAVLAMAHLNAGRLRQACRICSDAIIIAEEYRKKTQYTLSASASIYAITSRIFSEWGENEKAIQSAYTGLTLSEQWGQADTETLCLEFLGRTLVFANHWENGWNFLKKARSIARNISPWMFQMAEVFLLDSLLDYEQSKSEEITNQIQRVQDSGAYLTASVNARLQIRENRPDDALKILNQAILSLNEQPSFELVRYHALQALAFYVKQEEKLAIEALIKAFSLAESENRIATFVREGKPMENLIQIARKKSIFPDFSQRLLLAFEKIYTSNKNFSQDLLIETLSDREMEVLRNLNSHLSTLEIAKNLTISANTVHTHIKNIYGKLGVHGRSEAVREAKRLGIL